MILLALPGTAIAAPFSVSGPASVSEGAGAATYTVDCGTGMLDLPNTGALNVSIDPPAGADYGAPSSTLLTCLPTGELLTFNVPITNDTADENGEVFTVTVAGVLVTVGSVSQGVPTTITDDDPVASIDPVVLLEEGDSGTSVANLTVTLASTALTSTTIGFSTENFSATSGSDYTATSGQIVIPAGQNTGTISIPIVGDTTPEKTEAFYVNLTTTSNGSLDVTKKQGAIGIFDNDKAPLPTVALPKSASVEEGDTGTTNLLFNVKLSSPAGQRTEVKWKTIKWTADKTDYDSSNGTVVFKTGQKSKTISVDVKGDRRNEPDEAFAVELQNPVAATLGAQKSSFGIIEDDDGPKMKIGKPRLRGERLVAKVGCPRSADECKGKLVGKSAGLRLGRKRFNLDGGEAKRLKLKLSDAAQEALAERRRRAKLKATASDSTGDKRVTTRKTRLKRLH